MLCFYVQITENPLSKDKTIIISLLVYLRSFSVYLTISAEPRCFHLFCALVFYSNPFIQREHLVSIEHLPIVVHHNYTLCHTVGNFGKKAVQAVV